MKGGYKIIDFKHVPLSDSEHPALVPDLRTVLDENYGKAVLLTNVVLGEDSMDDCFSTVVLKSNGRIKLNSYDGYITVDSDSYAHYTEGGSGDPTAEIEEIKEDIQDIQSDIGDLSELDTEEKTSLVGSINEVDSNVDDVSEDLGDISDLETETKTSGVAAINELNTKLSKTEVLISNSGDAYDPTRPYKVGEYCIYNDTLYRCTTACSAGTWSTNQSCFTQDTLTNAANTLKSGNDSTLNALTDCIKYSNGTIDTGLLVEPNHTYKRTRVYNSSVSMPNDSWVKIGAISNLNWALYFNGIFRLSTSSNMFYKDGEYFDIRVDNNNGDVYVKQKFSSSTISVSCNVVVEHY